MAVVAAVEAAASVARDPRLVEALVAPEVPGVIGAGVIRSGTAHGAAVMAVGAVADETSVDGVMADVVTTTVATGRGRQWARGNQQPRERQ